MAQLAVELETFLTVLQQMTPSLKVASSVPTYVVALKDRDAYNAFQLRNAKGKREKLVAGYFSPGPDGIFMVMPWGGSDDESLRVVLHEFTHYLASRNVSALPLWIAEGVAEFYATFHIDKERSLAVVGEPPRDRLPWLYVIPLMPLDRLTSIARPSELSSDPQDLGLFYSQSWALVHYLFVGNRGARTKQIGAYVRALAGGAAPQVAFTSAFGGTYEQLHKELFDYIKDSRFPYLRLKPATTGGLVPDASRVDAMPEGEAAALQAAIYLRIGAADEAEAAFARAQSQPPSGVQARIALDRVRVQLGLAADAGAKYDELVAMTRAAAAKPLDASMHFHLSLAALIAGREEESDAALGEALRLLPDLSARRQHAYMAFALGRDAATARDVRAFFEAPGSWRSDFAPCMAFLGALALRRLHQPDEAAGLLDKAGPSVGPGTWTMRVLDYMRGAISAAVLLDAADTDDERTEAHTYVGFDDALAGRRDWAIKHFRWVLDKGSRNHVEYPIAVAELKRLERAS
jgi:tetratricopeptide (TPR) repeat protein